MKYIENIKIKVFWTNNIDEKALNDFLNIQNEVFGINFTRARFEKKYLMNIYGSSIIILAYIEGKCVGARSFWRNDIEFSKAFQPCDTAVLKEYRGRGIFRKMTNEALKLVDEDFLIYNFPNDNSYPAYLKLGWKFYERKRYKLYNPYSDYNEIDKIDDKYLEWMLTGEDFTKSLYYTSIKGDYYLITKKKYNFYVIVGRIEKKYTLFLNKAKIPICFFYSRKGNLGRGLITITRNLKKDVYIPTYKIDTLF